MLFEKGGREPRLTLDEITRVNEVLKWARKHESCLTFEVLGSIPRLMEMVYAPAGHVAVDLVKELVRVPLNPSPPAANTRGATPRKDKAPAVGDKPKKIDKGKGKLVEPEKPKKTTYPIQTGGAFKIRESRPPSLPAEGTATVAHPKVAMALKLADEEKLKVEKPIEGTPEQTPRAEAPAQEQGVKEPHTSTHQKTAQEKVHVEESDVQEVEAPLIKRKKLKKGAEPTALEVEPVAPTVEAIAPAIKVPNVAGFLVARRGQAPPPSMPRVEEVTAFLANELIPAVSMNAVELVEEPLVVPEELVKEPLGVPEEPIPSMLNQQLGFNIQHILEDLEMASKDSVRMTGENLEPFVATAGQAPQGPLPTIPETEASSRAPTPKRSQSLSLIEKASSSKRPRVSEKFESTVEIQPKGANWTFGGRLAKFRRDLKGNPVKAVFDLFDHQNLQLKDHDLSARGMAEEMLALHFLVSVSSFG
jgi:hypothetical protein